ncbi:MAG: hypothetical protein C4576_13535 [Desulfobacteraceae bacterium]|nr:MAG: hypothetical protein C4576_13535 [Desulfobacteraceae bacterium]
MENEPVFIIANPQHSLGFLVVGHWEPIGYVDGVEALSVLGRLRKEQGCHLKLYVPVPVVRKVATLRELKEYNAAKGMKDFDYSLVEDYLTGLPEREEPYP